MKKKILVLFFTVALLLCAAVSIMAKNAEVPVSPGLSVLALRTDMAKAAIIGDNIGFTKEDFLRSLNLSSIKALKLESLPDESEGRLLLGKEVLGAGASISASELDLMTFVPASDEVRSGSFDFSVGTGYSIKCNLYFIEKTNYSPTVSLASEGSLTVNTHDEVSHIGSLDAYDPEGDKFVYEIVSYPKNGSLVLLERDSGKYVYSPRESFKGTDAFEYVARDIYGNYSAKATVSVNVKERTTSVSFGDIDDCNTYNAALTMAEHSLMSGTLVDGITYFSPDQNMTRAEFLALAMKAVGISDPAQNAESVFADDEDIPGELKGYINTAYSLGIINGSEIDGSLCFLPNSEITRAEAAVMMNGLLSYERSVEAPIMLPVFADGNSIPSWASDAIHSMNSLGIMPSSDGYASPEQKLSRGDAAQMLASVINLID